MTFLENESRPGAVIPGAAKSFGGDYPKDTPRGYSLAELDDLAQHVGGTWVVAVFRAGGTTLTRTYVNVRAARRAALRARDRGHTVRVVLAELTPVWTLADLEGGESR